MNILRLIPSVSPSFGGPVEGIRQVSPILRRHGITTEVASFDTFSSQYVRDFVCKVNPLGSGVISYSYSHQWIPWIRSNCYRFDVVIIHGIWQFTSFGGWLALRKSKLPYFLYTHGMLDPWFNRTYPLKTATKNRKSCPLSSSMAEQKQLRVFCFPARAYGGERDPESCCQKETV